MGFPPTRRFAVVKSTVTLRTPCGHTCHFKWLSAGQPNMGCVYCPRTTLEVLTTFTTRLYNAEGNFHLYLVVTFGDLLHSQHLLMCPRAVSTVVKVSSGLLAKILAQGKFFLRIKNGAGDGSRTHSAEAPEPKSGGYTNSPTPA